MGSILVGELIADAFYARRLVCQAFCVALRWSCANTLPVVIHLGTKLAYQVRLCSY